MANTYFSFKQFTVHQDKCAMKVTTDACLFGAWCAAEIAGSLIRKGTLLDIGTGTGLLSLMVAQKTDLAIDAVEIDSAAAAQAMQNVSGSAFGNRICVYDKDIRDFQGSQYDLVISNPPFYNVDLEGPHGAKNTAHHGTGMNWATVFTAVRQKLAENGQFFLLLPYKRRDEIPLLLEQNGLHADRIVYMKQTTAHAPFRVMLAGSTKETELVESEIAVRDEAYTYTPAFEHLLRDYYLYL